RGRLPRARQRRRSRLVLHAPREDRPHVHHGLGRGLLPDQRGSRESRQGDRSRSHVREPRQEPAPRFHPEVARPKYEGPDSSGPSFFASRARARQWDLVWFDPTPIPVRRYHHSASSSAPPSSGSSSSSSSSSTSGSSTSS